MTSDTDVVTRISGHGFWLMIGVDELHVPFEDFPWFKHATQDQITAVEQLSPDRVRWPLLDVDLSARAIRRPEDFPLMWKG